MATDVSVIIQDDSNNVVLEDTSVVAVSLTEDQLVVVEDHGVHVVSVGEQGPSGASDYMVEYTVAALPAGTIGARAYVTDATAPTYLGALVGGGAVVCPVFHNGTAWVSA